VVTATIWCADREHDDIAQRIERIHFILGFDRPVLFDRHAVGGEYSAGWKSVGAGRLITTFFPDDGSSPVICDDRYAKILLSKLSFRFRVFWVYIFYYIH